MATDFLLEEIRPATSRQEDSYLQYLEELLFRVVMSAENRGTVVCNGQLQPAYDEETQVMIDDIKQRWDRHVNKYYPEEYE